MTYRQYISQIANQQVVALRKDVQYQNYSASQLLQLAYREIAILLDNKAHLSNFDISLLGSQKIPKKHQKLLNNFLKKRQQSVPLSYITGENIFCDKKFKVNPATLIPRPETEKLVDLVTDYLQKKSDLPIEDKTCLVDIGTGSGCIIISIIKKISPEKAKRIDQCAIDISQKAITTAKTNANQIIGKDCQIKFQKISFQKFLPNLFKKNFDSYVLVANLPYLSKEEYHAISPEVRGQEPKKALVGGREGQEEIIQLIKQVSSLASRKKRKKISIQLFLEISPTIYPTIKKYCKQYKYGQVATRPNKYFATCPLHSKTFRDLSGKIRFLKINLNFIGSPE